MTAITILDLDNCISDDTWRMPMISEGDQNPRTRYEAYHAACMYDDSANPHAWKYIPNCVIITTRPIYFLRETERWLMAKGVQFSAIFMRHVGDFRESAIIKMECATLLLEDNQEIANAYDDRADVIDAYRSLGIKATQLAVRKLQ